MYADGLKQALRGKCTVMGWGRGRGRVWWGWVWWGWGEQVVPMQLSTASIRQLNSNLPLCSSSRSICIELKCYVNNSADLNRPLFCGIVEAFVWIKAYRNFFSTFSLSVPVAASTGHRCLRSPARGDLMVPRTITYGSRSFAVSGPRVYNDLPPTLRSSSTTLGQFQSRLKTTLFRLAYGMWLGAFVTV